MPFADANGVKLHYQVYGEGEPVVFVHGVAITSRVWDFQKELSGTFKMLVYDHRGSGKSEKTPETFHTAELLCEDLKGLVDFLGFDRFHIVGISLGAAVAMKFAIKYPDRVRRLILSGAFADLDGLLNVVRKYFGHIIGKLLMTRTFGELAVKLMLPSAPKEERLYYHRNIIGVDDDEVRKYEQILKSYSITSALERIKSPTLMLYGQYEQPLHKYGRLIKQKIKNSRMEIIPGVGHGWNGEKPELFNGIVTDFLLNGEVPNE